MTIRRRYATSPMIYIPLVLLSDFPPLPFPHMYLQLIRLEDLAVMPPICCMAGYHTSVGAIGARNRASWGRFHMPSQNSLPKKRKTWHSSLVFCHGQAPINRKSPRRGITTPWGRGTANEILPRLDFWKPGFREYSGATAEFGILCERERSLGPLGFGVPLTVIGQLG